jgi:prepilin-type N-terminal cleavage/methylation domain-containing protein
MPSLKFFKKIKGFTLVEIMVSLMILALLASGVFSVMVSMRHLVAHSKKRMGAIEVARRVIEDHRKYIRADTWDNITSPLNPSGSWSGYDYSYPPYRFRTRVDGVAGSDCRKIAVDVRWDEQAL